MWRSLIGLAAVFTAACEAPERIKLPPQFDGFKTALFVSVNELNPDLVMAERVDSRSFFLKEPAEIYLVGREEAINPSTGPLEVRAGPWLKLSDFKTQCKLRESGFDCGQSLPQAVAEKSLVDVCETGMRTKALRLGCVDDSVEFLRACALNPNFEVATPVPPDNPTPVTSVDLPASPAWQECGAFEAPDIATGACVRWIANCDSGPWPPSNPGDVYVHPDANPGGDGSARRPYNRIEEAMSANGDILLGEASYPAADGTNVSKRIRGLCPELTTIDGDLVFTSGGNLAGIQVVGGIILQGENEIRDSSILGPVHVSQTATATLENVVLSEGTGTPALSSMGHLSAVRIVVRAPTAVGVDIGGGSASITELVARTTVRSVGVRGAGHLIVDRSWVEAMGETPAFRLTENSSTTVRSSLVRSSLVGFSIREQSSLTLTDSKIEDASNGINSSQDGQRQLILRNVLIQNTDERGFGIYAINTALRAERVRIEGPFDSSIYLEADQATSLQDIEIINLGYWGEQADPDNPNAVIPKPLGSGITWRSLQGDTPHLTLNRAHLTGVPNLAIHAQHDFDPAGINPRPKNDRVSLASATISDIDVEGSGAAIEGAGQIAFAALELTAARLRLRQPGKVSGITMFDRGSITVSDLQVTGTTDWVFLSLRDEDTKGRAKPMSVVLTRAHVDAIATARSAISAHGDVVHLEDIYLRSFLSDGNDEETAAMSVSGPGIEPVGSSATAMRIEIETDHLFGLQMEDFNETAVEATDIRIQMEPGPGSVPSQGLHFEDTNFVVDRAIVVGPVQAAVGTERKNQGLGVGFKLVTMRNVFAPESLTMFQGLNDPCDVPPGRFCNLYGGISNQFLTVNGTSIRSCEE